MNTISLNKLLDYLGYSDIRAARKWCNKNNVFIMKHGKSEFVYETDFKVVWERPFINKLKTRFGDNWKSVYKLYSDGNIPALNMLIQSTPFVSQKKGNKILRSKSTVYDDYLNTFKEHVKAKTA